jgi:hypothetical protein
MALESARTDPEASQSERDTAEAFLTLGKGDRDKALALSQMLDRPIRNQGCEWEYGGDRLSAAEAAVRARREASDPRRR